MHHAAPVTGSSSAAHALVVRANPVADWFSNHTDAFISGLVDVGVILLVAAVARALAGRLVTHAVRRMVTSQQRLTQAKAKAVRRTDEGGDVRTRRQVARAETVGAVLRSIASLVIFGVAFVMVLGEIGINLGPILASAGVLGLAVGFGAQSLVQDFLAGLFMMAEDQYGVGDVIDAGDAVGTVEGVTLRVTKIRDLNGGLWYVRNGEILRVCNLNQDWANAVVEVPVDYAVDVAKAKDVITRSMEEFASDPAFAPALLEQPVVAGVTSIGNGAVNIRVMVKTKPGEQWGIGRAMRAQLKHSFDVEGVQVAYPMLPLVDSGATRAG